MRKPLPFAISSFCLALGFVACSSDSDSNSNGDDSSAGADSGDDDDDDDDGEGGEMGIAGASAEDAGARNGGSSNGGGDTMGEPPAAIPLSEKDFDISGETDEKALAQLVGKYPVAVFYTSEGKQADLGAGTIDVAYDGDIVTLTLKTGGATTVKVANSRTKPVNYGQAAFTKVLGKILVDQRDSPFERIDVTLAKDGFIYGYVGGSGQFYHFRNNVLAYGPVLPQYLLNQAGTWSGPQLALTCNQPPVTVEIGVDARVKISGTANLDCMKGNVENKWDGQDDFVAPAPNVPGKNAVAIVIDSAKGGGSQASGGISVIVDADPKVDGLIDVTTTLEGARGNLEVQFPKKQ